MEARLDERNVPQTAGWFVVNAREALWLHHHEAGQEDFLVLKGEALLIVEGETYARWGEARPGPPPPIEW